MRKGSSVAVAVTGAFLGHVLAFLLVMLLLSRAATLIQPVAVMPVTEEVSVMLSELINEETIAPRPQNQHYVRTDADQETNERPENTPFHSDHNTRAASRAPAVADAPPVPSIQTDFNLPVFEMRDRSHRDGALTEKAPPAQNASAGSPGEASPFREALPSPPTHAAPSPPAQQSPPSPPETPAGKASRQPEAETVGSKAQTGQSPDDPPDALQSENGAKPAPEKAEAFREAQRTETSTEVADTAESAPLSPPAQAAPAQPAPKPPLSASTPANHPGAPAPDSPPSPKPPSPDPAFNPETRRTSMEGSIGRRGDDAVDAEANALGRYKKQVLQTIERQWHQNRRKYAEYVTFGTLQVTFRVDAKGNPKGLKIVRNDTSAVTAEFTVKSILEADIPPMPEDVASILGDRGLEIDYRVLLY